MINKFPQNFIDQIKEEQKSLTPLLEDFQLEKGENYSIKKMSIKIHNGEKIICFEIAASRNGEEIPLSVEVKDNDGSNGTSDRYMYEFTGGEYHSEYNRFRTIIFSFLQEKELIEIMSFFDSYKENDIEVFNVMSVNSLLEKRKGEDLAIKNHTVPGSIIFDNDKYTNAKMGNIHKFRSKREKNYKFLQSQGYLKPEIIDVWGGSGETVLGGIARFDEISSVKIYDQAIASMIRGKSRNSDIAHKIKLYGGSPWDGNDFDRPTHEGKIFNVEGVFANLNQDPQKTFFLNNLASCMHQNDIIYADIYTAHTEDIGIKEYNDRLYSSRMLYESLSEEDVICKGLENYGIYERGIKKSKSDIDGYMKAIQTVFNPKTNIISSSIQLSRDTMVGKKHSYRFDPGRDGRYMHKAGTHEKLVDSKRYFVDGEKDVWQKAQSGRNDEIALYFAGTPFELVRVNKGHYVSKLILKKRIK